MKRLLPLLLSLACSSGSPATYERGALTAPPPAQQRPGVGLPTYDPHVKPLPPQPNPRPKRLLPPTREPGIWASDEPRDPGPILPVRKRGESIPDLWLGTFRCPLAPEAQDAVDTLPVERCVSVLGWAAWRSGVDHQIDAIKDEGERHCLLATMLEACLRTVRDNDAEDVDILRGILSETDLLRRLKMASASVRDAHMEMNKLCGHDARFLSPTAREYLKKLGADGGLTVLDTLVLTP